MVKSILLSSILLYAARTLAQDDASSSSDTKDDQNTDSDNTNTKSTSSSEAETKTEDSTDSESSTSKVVITGGSSKASKEATAALPTITSYNPVVITAVNTIDSDSNSKPTATLSRLVMPTLSSTGVPLPTVTVPSNSNNPFMAQSNMPEGTVFIAVGAILGGIVAAVFAWHIVLALVHKRTVRKFNDAYAAGSDRLYTESKPRYRDVEAGRTGASGPASAGSPRDPGSGSTRSMINSGLFFSPTAEVMHSVNHHMGPGTTTYNPATSGLDSMTSTMGSGGGGGAGVGIATRSSRASNSYLSPGVAAMQGSSARSAKNMSMYSVGSSSYRPAPSKPAAEVRAPSAYLDDFLGEKF